MNKSVILYGPAGSGKTAIAERLAKHLGLVEIVDDVDIGARFAKPDGVLYITNAPRIVTEARRRIQCLHIDEAKAMLGIVEPANDNSDKATISETACALNMLANVEPAARIFGDQFHRLAKAAGWYNDPATGEPLVRNRGEMLALIHSEISEALEGERKSKMDDHLPHRKAAEVELADALIRIFDYAGYCGYDVIGAAVEKAAYNARRADHKPENRAKAGGKAF